MDSSALLKYLENEHLALQKGLAENEMRIRKDVKIKMNPSCRFGFEFFCHRSPEMCIEMDAFIKYAEGKKCLLDIGAAHGLFSLVFCELNKDGVAHAFEPSQSLYDVLVSNSEESNISANKVALSDSDISIKYYKEWEHIVIGEPTQDWKNANTEEGTIECITGDSFCRPNSTNIPPIKTDIIKLDVEGHEVKVLKGLRETLAKYHPVIFLELHIGRMHEQMTELIDLVYDLNYRVINTADGKETSLYLLRDTDPDQRLILV